MLLAAIGLLCLLVAAACARTEEGQGRPADEWVAKVNGEPVSARLFERRLVRNRSDAYRHFGQRYGVSDSAGFWTTPHEGVTPLDWLRQTTLEECVRIVIEQTLAREKGVLSDIGYPAFLQALDRENERRRRALHSGEPVYGPQQYGEDDYFQYLFSNMVIEVKRRLAAELALSDDALRQQYEQWKDNLYRRGDRVVVWAISVPFGRRSPERLSQEAARAVAEGLRAKLSCGRTFEEIRAACGADAALQEMVFDDQSARADTPARARARAEADKLAAGEVSPIFEERGAYRVVKCVSRQPLGYQPFDEVRDNVRARYVDQRYEELVGDLVRKAKVEINSAVYQATRVR